jgi:hypothetical protein
MAAKQDRVSSPRAIKNRELNEDFRLAKAASGFGARERRRLLSGKRIATTQKEREFLIDRGRSDLILSEEELKNLYVQSTIDLDEE